MAVAPPLPRRLPRPHRDAIPLADGVAFRDHARRHALVRALLAAALVGMLVLAFMAARRLPAAQSGVLPPGRSGVVILDLSASIDPRENAAIHESLRRLAASGDRYGLVLFSDDAYEAMPPGMSSSQLESMLRFYKLPKGRELNPPLTPWSYDFRGGTRISSGMQMALDILRRDRVKRGALILISDLFDAPSDAQNLQHTVQRFYNAGIPMRVVSLAPQATDARFFRNILGPRGIVTGAKALPEPVRHTHQTGARPAWLVAAVALLLLLLALNELLCGRLTWRRQPA
jgi:von Willebrand factor type A domain